MRFIKKILLLLILSLSLTEGYSQQYVNKQGQPVCELIITIDNDTLYLVNLHPLYVFPPLKFKNKRQEKFYWKTVRDVKKTLPYARIVGKTLLAANDTLRKLPDDKTRRTYLKQLEKEIKKEYEDDLRDMTFSQGKMLIKLINRETSYTSYELIKMYRGGFVAGFWQGIARLFSTNLKMQYNANDKEKIIERVILLVQSGQL